MDRDKYHEFNNKLREIFAQHELPEVLVSGNSPNFTNKHFEMSMRKNAILHVTSAPYHPTSNSLKKSKVQTVKAGIGKTAGDYMEMKLQRFLSEYH